MEEEVRNQTCDARKAWAVDPPFSMGPLLHSQYFSGFQTARVFLRPHIPRLLPTSHTKTHPFTSTSFQSPPNPHH